MAITTITFTTKLEGSLTNATSVVLSNSAGTAGIIRNDTGVSVVDADTGLVNATTGSYSYEFTPPVEDVFYTAYIKVIASGSTVHQEVVFYVGVTSSMALVPSSVMAQYVISTLGLFNASLPSAEWSLYQAFLPDSDAIEDDVAAIFDATPYTQGKHMQGALDQRYAIEFLIRSTSYDTGFKKAKTLLDSLQNKSQVSETIGGNTFIIENISSVTGVTSLGTERSSKQRFIFSVNLLVTIKEQ